MSYDLVQHRHLDFQWSNSARCEIQRQTVFSSTLEVRKSTVGDCPESSMILWSSARQRSWCALHESTQLYCCHRPHSRLASSGESENWSNIGFEQPSPMTALPTPVETTAAVWSGWQPDYVAGNCARVCGHGSRFWLQVQLFLFTLLRTSLFSQNAFPGFRVFSFSLKVEWKINLQLGHFSLKLIQSEPVDFCEVVKVRIHLDCFEKLRRESLGFYFYFETVPVLLGRVFFYIAVDCRTTSSNYYNFFYQISFLIEKVWYVFFLIWIFGDWRIRCRWWKITCLRDLIGCFGFSPFVRPSTASCEDLSGLFRIFTVGTRWTYRECTPSSPRIIILVLELLFIANLKLQIE